MLFTIQEICKCCSVLRLSCSQENLNKPTPDFAQRLVISLVEEAKGISLAKNQIQFSPTFLEDPKAHTQSAKNVATLVHLMDLMLVIGMGHCSLADSFFRPTTEGLIELLSGLLSFITFRHKRIESYNRMAGPTDQLSEQKGKLLDSINNLRSQRDEILSQRNKDAPKIADIQEQVDILKLKVRSLNTKVAQYEDQLQEKRLKLNNLVVQIKTAKLQVKSKTQEIQALRDRIMPSESELDVILSSLRKKLAQLEAQHKDCVAKHKDLGLRIIAANNARCELGKNLKKVGELSSLVEILAVSSQVMEQTRAKIVPLSDALDQTESSIQTIEGQIKQEQNTIEREAKHAEKVENHLLCSIPKNRFQTSQSFAKAKAEYDLLYRRVTSYHDELRSMMKTCTVHCRSVLDDLP